MSTNTARHLAELLSLDKIITEQGELGSTGLANWSKAAENLFDVVARGGQVGQTAVSEMTAVIGELTAAATKTHDGLTRWNADFTTLLVNAASLASTAKSIEANWAALTAAATDDTGLINKGLKDVIATEALVGTTTASVAKFKRDAVTSAEAGIQDALGVTSAAYQQQQADIATLATLSAQYATASSSDQRDKIQAQIDQTNKDLVTQGAIISVTQIQSQQAATAIAATVAGSIANEIAAGKSFIDAVRDQQGAVTDLQQQLQATGYTGGAAFDFVKKELALATGDVSGPALKAIEGYTAAEVGLANAGQLSGDTFAGLADQIGATEKALEAQGTARADVLPAMQKDLQTIWELQQQNGQALDSYTQGLVDEAVKQGIVGETHKTVSQQMLDALQSIAKAADALVQVFTGVADKGIKPLGTQASTTFGGVVKDAQDAGKGISDTFGKLKFTIPVSYDVSGPPPPPSGDTGAPSFANEGFIASPTLAMVGDAPGGEYVLRRGTVERLLDRAGLGVFAGAPSIPGGALAAALPPGALAAGAGGVIHETPMPIIVDGRVLTMLTIRHMGEMTRLMGVPT
jgi:hypothetical protein